MMQPGELCNTGQERMKPTYQMGSGYDRLIHHAHTMAQLELQYCENLGIEVGPVTAVLVQDGWSYIVLSNGQSD